MDVAGLQNLCGAGTSQALGGVILLTFHDFLFKDYFSSYIDGTITVMLWF